MKRVFSVFLILIIFSFSLYASVIVTIDGKEITDETLKAYVKEVAGKKYESYLNSKEGKKKLAEFYINRYVLLDKAKKLYTEKDIKKLKHAHPNLDDDTLFLLHFINEQINNKIKVEEKELEIFMKSNGITDKNSAYAQLLTLKRKKMLDKLLAKLKAEHKIEYK